MKERRRYVQPPFSPYKWEMQMPLQKVTVGIILGVYFMMCRAYRSDGKETLSMLDSVFVVPPIYDDSYYGSAFMK